MRDYVGMMTLWGAWVKRDFKMAVSIVSFYWLG